MPHAFVPLSAPVGAGSLPRLWSGRTWGYIGVAALVLFVVVPLCNLAVPAGSIFHVSDFMVTLIGKIMCYAIVALAMDLIWGYTGILSLGHGLFFALGGYAMGMYLMRSIGHEGVYQSDLPDFMVFLDWKAYPWYWSFTDHFWYCALLVVLVPGVLAFVFGFFAFRSRIKGVYFSIITQALTYAFMLLFFRNDTGFGGNNGFTDFKRILGFPIHAPETRMVLFMFTGATLIPLDDGEVFFPSAGEPPAHGHGYIPGAAVDQQQHRVALVRSTDRYPLLDPSDSDLFQALDSIGRHNLACIGDDDGRFGPAEWLRHLLICCRTDNSQYGEKSDQIADISKREGKGHSRTLQRLVRASKGSVSETSRFYSSTPVKMFILWLTCERACYRRKRRPVSL